MITPSHWRLAAVYQVTPRIKEYLMVRPDGPNRPRAAGVDTNLDIAARRSERERQFRSAAGSLSHALPVQQRPQTEWK
jgi:hypothetical protein